jgi:S-DNA-T family DNA segregation ATPase FtsK/SpoIIIE
MKEEKEMVVFGEAILELVTKLQTTLDIRKYPIDKIEPHLIQTGPSLIVVPVALNVGESKKPIEKDLEDIERELGVKGIILENDPDRAYYIRFLVPRTDREFPELTGKSIKLSDEKNEHYFGISLGQDVLGGAYPTFLSEWPHLLVAGTTGSGKTTLLKAIIKQLNNLEEDLFRILIIDGKAEFDYQNIMEEEHFHPAFPKVLEGHEHAQQVLDWVVEEEIPRRSKAWREYLEKNKDAQNNPRIEYIKHCIKGEDFLFKPLIILIDEFAEIMLASRSDASVFEKQVQRIVQRGRSSLIHLILATQRPDAKVLKGAIKANLPSRISLALPTHHDSMTVLGSKGAEKLLGKGDLIFHSSKGEDIRLQGYNV